jgi:rhamnosyltransferase
MVAFARAVPSPVSPDPSRSAASDARTGSGPEPRAAAVDVSVLSPTFRGGELAERVVATVFAQRTGRRVEVVIVDSGSPDSERSAYERLGARVIRIPQAEFDHGATRDLAARSSSGAILVLLNQDALPAGPDWLESLLAPFASEPAPVAVQGAILEFPAAALASAGRRRFFWESCGARFYFTSESREWIAGHGGLGFSTVHCAVARKAWEQVPFGPAPILEDKKWQAEAARRGWSIVTAPEAVVWHTHDYDLRGLARRCASEGFGWRTIGVRYPARQALRDLLGADWREWRRGLARREMRRPAEIAFPVLRPLALWWGNRWGRRSRA